MTPTKKRRGKGTESKEGKVGGKSERRTERVAEKKAPKEKERSTRQEGRDKNHKESKEVDMMEKYEEAIILGGSMRDAMGNMTPPNIKAHNRKFGYVERKRD